MIGDKDRPHVCGGVVGYDWNWRKEQCDESYKNIMSYIITKNYRVILTKLLQTNIGVCEE